MKVSNRAELRAALDAAVERGLDQVRESFEAAGISSDDLDAILSSERKRLKAWRAEVEAYALHELGAPAMPSGATVTLTRRPAGRLH
ncbi:hypothetical protein [Bosea sp. LjRoot237]|uniref:hypothetical protein n=1 Tax=Bosea sp. LjRoot237 TaxID=3342292 RepID=UPI003ECD540F